MFFVVRLWVFFWGGVHFWLPPPKKKLKTNLKMVVEIKKTNSIAIANYSDLGFFYANLSL